MSMYQYIALGTAALTTACTTNDAGKQVVDYEKVRMATMLTCALAPTAAQIAQMYTDNKNVKTTKDVVALICAAAMPIIMPEDKK